MTPPLIKSPHIQSSILSFVLPDLLYSALMPSISLPCILLRTAYFYFLPPYFVFSAQLILICRFICSAIGWPISCGLQWIRIIFGNLRNVFKFRNIDQIVFCWIIIGSILRFSFGCFHFLAQIFASSLVHFLSTVWLLFILASHTFI